MGLIVCQERSIPARGVGRVVLRSSSSCDRRMAQVMREDYTGSGARMHMLLLDDRVLVLRSELHHATLN